MLYNEIKKALEIRYVDLKFTIRVLEDSILPVNKISALRGGMGQMLLMQNCIGDRNCKCCGFVDECLVRRMMYSKFEIQPEFATKGNSIGYVFECENHKEAFKAGELFTFHLLLYGKTIAYFSQFLQAFHMLGQYGLGKHQAGFEILKVENGMEQTLVDGSNVYLQRLGIQTIGAYAESRSKQLVENGCGNRMEFKTPVTIKYRGEFIREFDSEAIFHSVLRRIYSFDCFEGLSVPLMSFDRPFPQIVEQEVRAASIPRYSSTAKEKMRLKGICGYVVFDHLPGELQLALLAGEKLHIGKNTSFGFGQYWLK